MANIYRGPFAQYMSCFPIGTFTDHFRNFHFYKWTSALIFFEPHPLVKRVSSIALLIVHKGTRVSHPTKSELNTSIIISFNGPTQCLFLLHKHVIHLAKDVPQH